MKNYAFTAPREFSLSSSSALDAEWDWLICWFDDRRQAADKPADAISPPPDVSGNCPFASWLERVQLTTAERLLMALLTARELKPNVLHLLNETQTALEMGFAVDRDTQALTPTLRTWLWLLHGDNQVAIQATLLAWIQGNGMPSKAWVHTAPMTPGMPYLSQALSLSREGFFHLVLGLNDLPEFSQEFPAKLLRTSLEWVDLVLDPTTEIVLREVLAWFDYGDKMRFELGMSKILRPGFRVLFHGLPGTGKTMTAALLGKRIGRPVYRIDLSGLVSKYIGETEKNLATVFERAEQQGWILFFDEADALFGKRGKVSDARDRYAIQEVSYLLQRIEQFDGVCILATNDKNNLDPAFIRRIEAIAIFSRPKASERVKIWENTLPAAIPFAPGISHQWLAERYDLSGAEILNVARDIVLQVIRKEPPVITQTEVAAAINREFSRTGRIS